jgi:hypothetical protein
MQRAELAALPRMVARCYISILRPWKCLAVYSPARILAEDWSQSLAASVCGLQHLQIDLALEVFFSVLHELGVVNDFEKVEGCPERCQEDLDLGLGRDDLDVEGF